jgi:hypothetical protein
VKPEQEVARQCEILFQNGGGRAQVRRPDGLLVYGCERMSAALLYAMPEQVVLYRAKRRGALRYEWIIVRPARPHKGG